MSTLLISKIIDELTDLKTKISNLESFITSSEFLELSGIQRKLLEQQHAAMQEYKIVLMRRVCVIREEYARKEATEAEDGTQTSQ